MVGPSTFNLNPLQIPQNMDYNTRQNTRGQIQTVNAITPPGQDGGVGATFAFTPAIKPIATDLTANMLPKTNVLSGAQKFGILGKEALGNIAGNDPGAFGQVAQGLAGIAGGIIGGGARRREQREARRELAEQREAYEQFQFQDPTANMTNPFEDLTVNQQQAQFQAQQNQQALAGTLSSLQGAAGGSGIGALAQAIAQQQQQGMQQAAASIGMQESRNQVLRARGQQALEMARSRGAQYVQDREFGRVEDLFSIAAARKVAADEARRQATQNLVGGIGNLAVGGVRAAISGGIL